jgi:signal transduction histidine kinase
MARASVASASAHLDSAGFAQSVVQPTRQRLLAVELLLSRAVPILIVAFLATVCVGTVVHVLVQRHEAVNNSSLVLDAVAELGAANIETLKQANNTLMHPQDVLAHALPVWTKMSGRRFLLTNKNGTVIAAIPNDDAVGQQLTSLFGTIPQNGDTAAETIEQSDGEPALIASRPLGAPFGRLVVMQSYTDAQSGTRSLVTLTTTLSTTTGCVVLILGFAFYWQGRRAREMNLMNERVSVDILTLTVQKDKVLQREKQLTSTIADLRDTQENITLVEDTYVNDRNNEEVLNRIRLNFLTNISHEFRTPLNAIMGFSEIMKSEIYGPLGADKYREYCGDIHNSGQYLLEIINDILNMSEREVDTASKKVAEKSHVILDCST